MTSSRAENPQAFPSLSPPESWGDPARGMSLRDWMAGQALAGIAATITNMATSTAETRAPVFSKIGQFSYEIADAMLAARAPQPKESGE